MQSKFIIKVQGKEFIKFEGLLNEFHENGGKEIYTKIIQKEPLIIQATVKGEKGVYQGIGDADKSNVNSLIANHKIRMAETRAIARALRWYNNIGMCSSDELGEGVKETNRIGKKLLFDKLKKEGITENSKPEDILSTIENKTGVKIKDIKELTEEKAKQIIEFWA